MMKDYTKYLPMTLESYKAFEPWFFIDDTYKVSAQGNVMNYRTGHILKPYCDSGGYLRVGLRQNGKTVHYLVHRLVAMAILGAPKDGMVVDHFNFVRDDNRFLNLNYLTLEDNSRKQSPKAVRQRLERWSELWKNESFITDHAERNRKKMSKLWAEKDFRLKQAAAASKTKSRPVKQIDLDTGEVLKTFSSATEAGRELGVNYKNICQVATGKRKSCGGFGWQY